MSLLYFKGYYWNTLLVRTVRVYAIHSEKNVPSAGASQKVSNEYPDYKTIRKEYKFYSASYCKNKV